VNFNKIISIGSFAILTLLWLGFGAALIFNRAILDTVWQAFLNLPLLGRIGLGVLLLPIMLGLWIWESSWSIWLRLILVIGLGVGTIYLFFPKRT